MSSADDESSSGWDPQIENIYVGGRLGFEAAFSLLAEKIELVEVELGVVRDYAPMSPENLQGLNAAAMEWIRLFVQQRALARACVFFGGARSDVARWTGSSLEEIDDMMRSVGGRHDF